MPDELASRPGRSRLHRLARAFVRPGRGQVIAAVMLFLVGLAGVMQIRTNTADDTYRTARREDLIQLLDGLTEQSRRLESEVSDLQATRDRLKSGADTRQAARQEAEQRVRELSILAGTLPASGPGIRMRIYDPQNHVDGSVLLEAVEELRDAGAEVIELNDTVRVVATSWFDTGPDGSLLTDGRTINRPLTIEAIGDPHALEEAARFRGGLVSEITGPRIGGQVDIDQLGRVSIDSLHAAKDNQYARPATAAPTPR